MTDDGRPVCARLSFPLYSTFSLVAELQHPVQVDQRSYLLAKESCQVPPCGDAQLDHITRTTPKISIRR